MSDTGTTRCPHCDTRFKISEAQLETPHGMMRCGQCLHVFDARTDFVSEQPDRQLKLPILDEPESLNPAKIPTLQPMTLAEQVTIVQDEDDKSVRTRYRSWPWGVATLLLLLTLLAQATYSLRVELAAHFPGLKPALINYCRLLKCSVPLPQKIALLSIESSALEADPARANQVALIVLLRNRATYAQAFPSMELTLNDAQDNPIARRVFRPVEYLPPLENQTTGLLPNHEINLKLHLNTSNLKPFGYRLVLLDSNSGI